MNIFLILFPLFALVGIWLLIYSRKRSQLLKNFGRKKGLIYLASDDGRLEQKLDQAFKLEPPLARGFSRIRDIVTDNNIFLFRVTELLDLVPYRVKEYAHSGHVAVAFSVPKEINLFFFLVNQSEYENIHPPGKNLDADQHFQVMQKIIKTNPPPHNLSVTIMRKKALIYLMPIVTGAEKESDLEYLFDLAKEIKRVFI